MLVHRLRRRPIIEQTLVQSVVFTGMFVMLMLLLLLSLLMLLLSLLLLGLLLLLLLLLIQSAAVPVTAFYAAVANADCISCFHYCSHLTLRYQGGLINNLRYTALQEYNASDHKNKNIPPCFIKILFVTLYQLLQDKFICYNLKLFFAVDFGQTTHFFHS